MATDNPKISQAINQIRQAGFTLSLVERYLFRVEPIAKLTHSQRQFLEDHQAAIAEFLYKEQSHDRRTNQR